MLLEYVVSCEDRGDQAATARYMDHFGDSLGEKLIARLYDAVPEPAGLDHVSEVMDIVINSMGVAFQKELTADHLRYDLARSPIHEAARNSGLNLWVAAAHSTFVALCNRVLQTLAPEWELVHPADTEVTFDTVLVIHGSRL